MASSPGHSQILSCDYGEISQDKIWGWPGDKARLSEKTNFLKGRSIMIFSAYVCSVLPCFFKTVSFIRSTLLGRLNNCHSNLLYFLPPSFHSIHQQGHRESRGGPGAGGSFPRAKHAKVLIIHVCGEEINGIGSS